MNVSPAEQVGRLCLATLLLCVAAACALAQSNPIPSKTQPDTHTLSSEQATITNQDVLDLLKAGLAPEIVAAKVKASKCMCDTSPVALAELKAAAVPDVVVLAMVESNAPLAGAAKTRSAGLTDIRQAKTVYLDNKSTDFKVFDNLAKKLKEWGFWTVVDRPEDADLVLVFSEQSNYVGAYNTGSVYGSGTYASGSSMSIPLMSQSRFLIAVDRLSSRQLGAVSCERRTSSGYTAGVLVNRMRKRVEDTKKPESKP